MQVLAACATELRIRKISLAATFISIFDSLAKLADVATCVSRGFDDIRSVAMCLKGKWHCAAEKVWWDGVLKDAKEPLTQEQTSFLQCMT